MLLIRHKQKRIQEFINDFKKMVYEYYNKLNKEKIKVLKR